MLSNNENNPIQLESNSISNGNSAEKCGADDKKSSVLDEANRESLYPVKRTIKNFIKKQQEATTNLATSKLIKQQIKQHNTIVKQPTINNHSKDNDRLSSVDHANLAPCTDDVVSIKQETTKQNTAANNGQSKQEDPPQCDYVSSLSI